MKPFRDPTKGELGTYLVVSIIVLGVLIKMIFDRMGAGTFSWTDDLAIVVGAAVFVFLCIFLAVVLVGRIRDDGATRAAETEADKLKRMQDDKLRFQKNVHILLILLLAGSITATIVVFIALAGGFDFGPVRFLIFLFPFLIILFGMLYAMQGKYYREHGGGEAGGEHPAAEKPAAPSPAKTGNTGKNGKGSKNAKGGKKGGKNGKGAAPASGAGKAHPEEEPGARGETAGPFGFDPKTAGEAAVRPGAASDAGSAHSSMPDADASDGPADQEARTGKVDPFEMIRR